MSMLELKSTMEDSVNSPEQTISMLVSKLNMEPSKQENVSSSLKKNISNVRRCVTIDRQYRNLIHIFNSEPFTVRLFEDVIMIPMEGEFKRFEYHLIVNDKIIDHFYSLERFDDEFLMEESFAHAIEQWMKRSLNIK